VIIVINGQRREVDVSATVASVVKSMDLTPGARGLAVALEGEVVTRSRWSETVLAEGARIEIVAAIGGG
jgi:sulfur carrier protein